MSDLRPSSSAAISIQLFEKRPRKVPLSLAIFVCLTSHGAEFVVIWLATWGFCIAVAVAVAIGFHTVIAYGAAAICAFAGIRGALDMVDVAAIKQGLRQLRALRHGEAAYATWQSATDTNTEINGDPVREHRFNLETARGEKVTVTATALDDTHLRDEAQEIVLYDPANPTDAVVLGSIPGDPRPTGQGTFTTNEKMPIGVIVMGVVALLFWLGAAAVIVSDILG